MHRSRGRQVLDRPAEIVRARQRIAELISRETGKPLGTVLADIERDHWLSAEEAIDYGLVGRIIKERQAL